MNLYPHIEFSNNLIENQETIITYSGFLFEKNSESVTIVYGFGNNWDNTTELEMQKAENGFSAKIKALEFSNFNFCFRNSNYEWDNNNNQDYTAPISKPQIEDSFIINEGVINNILDDIVKYDISKIENTKVLPIENNTINEYTENKILEENNIIEDFEITVENNEPINIEESAVNIIEENSLNNDIEQVFNELYFENTEDTTNNSNESDEHNIEETENNSQSIQNKLNIDSLVNEILAPVKESTTFNEETFTISESFKTVHEEIFETSNELENDEKVNTLIDGLITNLYENVNSSIEKSINTEDTSSNLIEEANTDVNNDISLEENNNNVSIEKNDNTITSIEENNNNISEKETDNIIEKSNINNTILEELSIDVNNIFNEADSNNNLVENTSVENFETVEIDNDDFEDNLQEKIQDAIENNIINEFMEDSLLDNFNNSDNEIIDNSKALIETDNYDEFMISPRKLSKVYKFKKKVKLAFYKLLALPKTLFSNLGESKN